MALLYCRGTEDSSIISSPIESELFEQTYLDRWIRRAIIAGFGLGFSLPYFHLLNRIRVMGDEILETLPKKRVVFLSNHQTYFMEAIAFFDVIYVRHMFPWEGPIIRFSAAEETMKKNLLTSLMTKVGGVTIRRSFRDGGQEVKRPVDFEGAARIEQAIAAGWLLHFPAGTTREGAPFRPGVPLILHRTKAIVVPVRVDGFRNLLMHKQFPGKMFKTCSITLHRPLDLDSFYTKPYCKDDGHALIEQLTQIIGDPQPIVTTDIAK